MNTKFEKISIAFEQLTLEKELSKNEKLYSHNAFIRKFPKNAEFLSDFSIDEKLIELEFKNGERNWIDFECIFGKIISNASIINVKYSDENLDYLKIHSVLEFKIKRTKFLKLIFIIDTIPF